MFTLQSGQIENALRSVGVPDISAKEMMSGLANCQAPIEHRAPVALARPVVNYFPTIRPAGPTISPRFVSESNNTIINIPPWQTVPFTPLPYLPIPPWQTIPYPGWPDAGWRDDSFTVAGPVRSGPVTAPAANVTNVTANTIHIHNQSDRTAAPGPPGPGGPPGGAGGTGAGGGAGGAAGGGGSAGGGGIINEGDTHNYGDTYNEGDSYVNNDLTVQNNFVTNGPVTNYGPVYNAGETINNVVHNQQTINHGPTHHHSETHFDGPNYINGPTIVNGPTYLKTITYVNGTPLQVQTLDVVTDVAWDGTLLEQTKRQIKVFGVLGASSTTTVLDCDA